MKTYENFISDIFKSKMTAKKFTLYLVDFINSVSKVNDDYISPFMKSSQKNNNKVSYAWCHQPKNGKLLSHSIASPELEEYIIIINELDKNDYDHILKKFEYCFFMEFCELNDNNPVIVNDKYDDIIEDFREIQNFIKDKMSINYKKNDTHKLMVYVTISDIEKVYKDINKDNYETFLAQKKYNI